MGDDKLGTLRKQYEKAKKEYEFWTTGTKCLPGSRRWMEVESKYKIAHDAYRFALEHRNTADVKAVAAQESSGARWVFVIHGRDERLRSGIFAFLRALGLEPMEWTTAMALTGKASPYIGEILDSAFEHAQAVVVLLSPDDEARLRDDLVKENDQDYEKQLTGQARPNVLFEAGMAFAFQPKRTVLVQIGNIRPFSDVAGRHVVKMDNSKPKRYELATKLKTAGCSVDLAGSDWITAGEMTPPDTQPLAGGNSSPQTESHEPPEAPFIRELRGYERIVISPISRSSGSKEYPLLTADQFGVLVKLKDGEKVRIPPDDFKLTRDDVLQIPMLVLTRKYFQGYFPGHEHAQEYFLPRS